MDLRDLWASGSGVTPRYVLALVEQLPDDGAFYASVRSGKTWDVQQRPWGVQTQLLAAIANVLYMANTEEKKPLITPPGTPGPASGGPAPSKKKMTMVELRAAMAENPAG